MCLGCLISGEVSVSMLCVGIFILLVGFITYALFLRLLFIVVNMWPFQFYCVVLL